VRAAVVTVFALVGLMIGTLEVLGKRVPILQRDGETPISWLAKSPYLWAVQNGASLGVGAGSRLGFWLWYVIPVGAFASGTPMVGAACFGLYGLVRAGGVAGLLRIVQKHGLQEVSVLESYGTMRQLTSWMLLAVSGAAAIVVGL